MLQGFLGWEGIVFRYDGKGNGRCLRLAGVAVFNCHSQWVAALYYIITITKRESSYWLHSSSQSSYSVLLSMCMIADCGHTSDDIQVHHLCPVSGCYQMLVF
jgi:hypothetical protein